MVNASPPSKTAAETPPPKLRNDLILHHGPKQEDGAPTWTLYDPAGNRFFRIGWLEFECLTRFTQHETLQSLTQSINTKTALNITIEEATDFINFLHTSQLLTSTSSARSKAFAQQHKQQKKSVWKTLLHSYLFFILPLVNPDRFLQKTLPIITPLFTKKFFTGIIILLALSLFLTAKRSDEFIHTFISFLSWESLAFYMSAIICVKILHELSHAYMATKKASESPQWA